MVVAYLLGSVNAAIILTRILSGRDIRTLGNLNPGTANVGRTFGRGWGAVVFFWDGLKALAPLAAAQAVFFPADAPREAFALAAVGLAAVVGHRRPVWHGFRGGGGVASMVFVYGFFIPVETVVGLLLATGLAMVLLPRARYKFGRWVPIIFSVLAPVLAAGGSASECSPRGAHHDRRPPLVRRRLRRGHLALRRGGQPADRDRRGARVPPPGIGP